MKRLLVAVAGLLMGLMSYAQINLAGVYEGDMNDNITRKCMYVNLDFLNGVPDFTQIFTEKKAPLKILPADFMNAKKLKKLFAGQTAPGFIRFNSKTIFSSTEELKLTNTRLENGVLACDWINHDGETGKCFIIVNPDKTIQFLGLTTMATDMGPDNLVLTQVEDRLPAGVEPYVTAPELLGHINHRYCREILLKLGVDSHKGLSGVKVSINPDQVRRLGNDIMFPVQIYNDASKEARPLFGDHVHRVNDFAAINGERFHITTFNADRSIGPHETVMQYFQVVGVPLDAEKIDNAKIAGRAQYSHSTDRNPYGDFEYIFTDIVIPELQPSNRQGTYITDSDIQVNFNGTTVEGNNLIVNFTLINRSGREKKMHVRDRGIARTRDGEEYPCFLQLPETLMANDHIKGTLTIPDAASVDIRMARIPIYIRERNFDYEVMLHF